MAATARRFLAEARPDIIMPDSTVAPQTWPVDDTWPVAGIDADDIWSARTIEADGMWPAESVGACKVSRFLNWYDVGSCFFDDSWQIRSKSTFAISCLVIVIYAAGFQALCRWAKTYDRVIADAQDENLSNRFNIWADLGRAGIYTLQALCLLPMLILVFYLNAWYMICMLLGTFLGFFSFRRSPDMEAIGKRERFHECKSLP